MEKCEVTPFCIRDTREKFVLIKNVGEKAERKKKNSLPLCEKFIKYFLKKYGPITIHLLEELVTINHKKLPIRRTLKAMEECGNIVRYHMERRDTADLDVYLLPMEVQEEKKYIRNGIKWMIKPEENAETVMKHLRLLQWHVKTLRQNRDIREVCYCSFIRMENVRIPIYSLIQIKNSVHVHAMVAPKTADGKSIGLFLHQLLSIEECFGKNNQLAGSVIVLLCESTEHIAETAILLKEIKEFSEKDYLYSIDRICMENNPLEMLYRIEIKEEGTILYHSYNLRNVRCCK